MSVRQIVILAMTHMKTGICTAGLLLDGAGAVTGHWVRPVKKFGSLVLSDMTDSAGSVVRVGDVVELDLSVHRPVDNHVEDWVTNFAVPRPRIVRHMAGEEWARFLAESVDPQPSDVLSKKLRSLCLIRPGEATVEIRQSDGSDLKVHMWFTVDGLQFQSSVGNSASVTDLEFRARARLWLAEEVPQHQSGQPLRLGPGELAARLGCTELYLSFGWSRIFKDAMWPLVVGLHPLPHTPTTIDYHTL